MSHIADLLQSWATIKFDEAVDVVSDRGVRIKQKDYLLSGVIPIVDQGDGMIGGYTNNSNAKVVCSASVIVFGDHTRRFKFINFPFAVGADGVKLFAATEFWNSRFLFLQLGMVDLEDRGYGRHYQHLRKKVLTLPPKQEQTRIVEKLEELLSGLDAGVAELKAAQKKLTQYRQSLLKAAVEGALTADWRADQGNGQPAGSAKSAESGQALLARILTERRSRWQARQLAKFKTQGKPPPKDWQAKYPEPVAPDTAGLPALPPGWVWANVDQLSPDDLANGRSVPTAESGAKVLRLTAVKQGQIDLKECKTGSWSAEEAKPFAVVQGDLLIVRGNGSLTLVGRAGMVPAVTEAVAYPDTMIRLRVVESVVRPEWVGLLWDASITRAHLETRARTSAGIYKISQPDIVSVRLPIPPLGEQDVMLAMFQQNGEEMQTVQKMVEIGLKQSAAQRKNILKAAFSGQLVPQDPADEPASALLARIRAERTAREAGSTRGRGKKKEVV